MGCEEICAILARCVKVVRPSSFVAILDHAKASEVFQNNLTWKRFARLLLAAWWRAATTLLALAARRLGLLG